MKRNEWYGIAQCREEQGQALLTTLQEKWKDNPYYRFRFNVPSLQVVGIRTEHEFLYLDAFCSGFLSGLERSIMKRKETEVVMKMRTSDTDHQALLDIQELMDGVNWSPNTLDAIAEVLENAGYRVRDTDE